MDGTGWTRVQAIFHEAVELSSADARRAFVERACDGDDALVAEVMALLDGDARAHVLVDRDVRDVAGELWRAGDAAAWPAITRIGRYRILRTLGEGGMGIVYLAERDDLGQQVAIKVLRDASLSPARRERFRSEQRTLALLTHHAIARLYDADTLRDGTPWFAMEYVEGVTLDAWCRRDAPPLAARLSLFREICETVHYAHQRLVVHRDLKPSNILVTADTRVKLLDFGIAKQLDRQDAPVDQTRTALRLMTPAYAAPEQVRGDAVGVHTDVYALGVILYELLAGRRPFDLSSRTPREAETIILECEPERPSVASRAAAGTDGTTRAVAGKSAWTDLDVLCLTAMHKDPQRRYASVDALMRDLDHFRRGEPLEARTESIAYRAGKFTRRHGRALAAAAIVLVAVAGLAAFYTVRLASARDAALTEAARTQRVQQFMLNLFDAGEIDEAPASTLRVVTLLERGVREAKGLDQQPAAQAELYDTLGSVYGKLGQFGQAESLLQAALDRRRTLQGPHHPDVASSLVSLGLLKLSQAKLPEAATLVRAGFDEARASLPPAHPIAARATVAWGKVLEAQGAYDKAIPVLEEAVRLYTTPGPPTPELAGAMTSLANTHFYAGHLEEADALNRRIVEISRTLYGPRHPSVAHDLINLGATQYERGTYGEAERYRREALEIFQGWYGDEHPETASAMTLLAQAQIAQKRFDEAVGLLQRALAIQERAYGAMHPRVALVLSSLGSVAQQRNRLDDAEAAFARMLAIYRATYPDGRHQRIGVAQSNLAGVYLARHEHARAEALFREAVALFTTVLGTGHQQTAIARVKLGRALLRQRNYAEAEASLAAGYQVLVKTMKPGVSWLQSARQDLAEVYEAREQPQQARRYRDEYATYATTASASR